MSNPEHASILKKGVTHWNEWRQSTHVGSPLLDKMYLAHVDLSGINFHDAGLYFSNLQGADLRGADLSDAHIERVDLRNARLEGADMRTGYLFTALIEGATYDANTLWPAGFDPKQAGAILNKTSAGRQADT